MMFRLTALTLMATSPLHAEGLRIVTDIAPVQSLVQQLAGEDAEVVSLLPPGASPHGYALRPSEARALQDADLVVWIGPSLTPWLEAAIDGLAAETQLVTLAEVEGVIQLPYREVALFGGNGDAGHDHGDDDHDHASHGDHDHDHSEDAAHDHDHAGHDDQDHGSHDDHDHAEHDDHDHAEHDHGEHDHASHDDHDHAAADHKDHDDHADHAHHGHDHDHAGGFDPHMWLDPRNAVIWLDHLSGVLQDAHPDDAADITARAEAAKADLQALESEITAQLSSVQDKPFLVYHDAYQYFGTRFGVATAGAIAASDAQAPGPARLAELKAALTEQQIECVFYEPQFSPRLLAALEVDGTLRQAELDPLGSGLTPGPDLYPALLSDLADTMVECLAPQS